MKKNFISILIVALLPFVSLAQKPVPQKPRILISTDIGGTDPDDNQSLAHLLMYSDKFDIEGLVSSPSYGEGSKKEILRMIDLYEKDLPKLLAHQAGMIPAQKLRDVTRQGQKGRATYAGFATATEGSDWIIRCANKKADSPLWVLCWGGLEDLAQALHDDPGIQKNIRVYWIGGPNKKWSANAYAYIASHFPNLYFIEVNASYYGFFSDNHAIDEVKKTDYYNKYIRGAGNLGADFINYYKGEVKMGDTPSLLYMMDGDPAKPERESWGGSFEKTQRSARVTYNRTTSVKDTVAYCTVVEFSFNGPRISKPEGSICFYMETPYKDGNQKWAGYYLGNGKYGLRFIPKQAETIKYTITSDLPELNKGSGALVVTNSWPGRRHATDYRLGNSWYTDKADPSLYDGRIQGGVTVAKWRQAVLADWAERWSWLK